MLFYELIYSFIYFFAPSCASTIHLPLARSERKRMLAGNCSLTVTGPDRRLDKNVTRRESRDNRDFVDPEKLLRFRGTWDNESNESRSVPFFPVEEPVLAKIPAAVKCLGRGRRVVCAQRESPWSLSVTLSPSLVTKVSWLHNARTSAETTKLCTKVNGHWVKPCTQNKSNGRK